MFFVNISTPVLNEMTRSNVSIALSNLSKTFALFMISNAPTEVALAL